MKHIQFFGFHHLFSVVLWQPPQKKVKKKKKNDFPYLCNSHGTLVHQLVAFAVITTPAGAALSCTCSDTLPPGDQRSRRLCPPFRRWFLSFPLTSWGRFTVASEGLKNYYPPCLCGIRKRVKAKDWRLALWWPEALFFAFAFSKFSPIYQHHHPVSFQHHNGRHAIGKKNRKSICRPLVSALSGFERATNDV